MTARVRPAVAVLATTVLLTALLSTVSAAAHAVTAPPDEGPITVVIPPSASPSPSPTGSGGSGGSAGGGSGGGTGVDPGDGGTSGDPGACPAKNPDGSPVPAAQITEDAPELELDRDSLAAGEWIIVSSPELTRGEKAQVVLYPGTVVIGSYSVDAPTGFVARFRMPEGTPTGLYTLSVTGWQSCFVANGEVTVVSASPTSSPALWWGYTVIGAMSIGFISLVFAFRADIALWFGAASVIGPRS